MIFENRFESPDIAGRPWISVRTGRRVGYGRAASTKDEGEDKHPFSGGALEKAFGEGAVRHVEEPMSPRPGTELLRRILLF